MAMVEMKLKVSLNYWNVVGRLEKVQPETDLNREIFHMAIKIHNRLLGKEY